MEYSKLPPDLADLQCTVVQMPPMEDPPIMYDKNGRKHRSDRGRKRPKYELVNPQTQEKSPHAPPMGDYTFQRMFQAMVRLSEADTPHLIFRVKPGPEMIHYEKCGMAWRNREHIDNKPVGDVIKGLCERTRKDSGTLTYNLKKLVLQLGPKYVGSKPPLRVDWIGGDLDFPTAPEQILLDMQGSGA